MLPEFASGSVVRAAAALPILGVCEKDIILDHVDQNLYFNKGLVELCFLCRLKSEKQYLLTSGLGSLAPSDVLGCHTQVSQHARAGRSLPRPPSLLHHGINEA